MSDLYTFHLTDIFNMLFYYVGQVITWTQTNYVEVLTYRFSFFDLALGGYAMYLVLEKLPIWDKVDFPEPYHSEYEDDFYTGEYSDD